MSFVTLRVARFTRRPRVRFVRFSGRPSTLRIPSIPPKTRCLTGSPADRLCRRGHPPCPRLRSAPSRRHRLRRCRRGVGATENATTGRALERRLNGRGCGVRPCGTVKRMHTLCWRRRLRSCRSAGLKLPTARPHTENLHQANVVSRESADDDAQGADDRTYTEAAKLAILEGEQPWRRDEPVRDRDPQAWAKRGGNGGR